MRALVKFLLLQELYYGIFVIVVCVLISFDKGAEVGLRSAGYLMALLQLLILWSNRKLINATLFSEIKDKR